jgi:hypothetical protein
LGAWNGPTGIASPLPTPQVCQQKNNSGKILVLLGVIGSLKMKKSRAQTIALAES